MIRDNKLSYSYKFTTGITNFINTLFQSMQTYLVTVLSALRLRFCVHTNVTDEAQEAEAIQVLNSICDRKEQNEKDPQLAAQIHHALAMLYYVLHDIDKVNPTCTSHAVLRAPWYR